MIDSYWGCDVATHAGCSAAFLVSGCAQATQQNRSNFGVRPDAPRPEPTVCGKEACMRGCEGSEELDLGRVQPF